MSNLTPPPAPALAPAKQKMSGKTKTLIAVAVAVLLIALVLLAPVIAIAALTVLVTGIVALAKNTRTWLRFPSRKAAIIAVVVSAVVFLGAGTVSTVVYPSAAGDTPAVGLPAVTSTTPTTVESAESAGEPTTEPSADASVTPSATATPTADADAGTALALLATLDVKGRAPKTGYDRDQFGNGWLDPDHNGCDTRNDILARDLSDETKEGPCKVLTGVLADPYTATLITFQRGQNTSAKVQIDHVVALSDAWQKGAQQLTAAQREALANDPLNLLAVDGPANSQKSDGDAATWLPANKTFRCTYVARQVSVKAAYELWVTRAEHDAIAGILEKCPGEPAATSAMAATAVKVKATAAPEPEKTRKPTKEETADKPATSVYYSNCTAVRDADAAPIYRGDPGYGTHLDRDGDGVACE